MNNSPIDVLLQLPVPRVEPAQVGGRSRDESSAFDDHFRQASSAEASPSPTRSASQAPQRASDAPSEKNSQSSAAPTSHSSPSQSKSEAETEPASEPTTTTPHTDDEANANEDEREEDAAVVAAVAALEQVVETEPADLGGEAKDPSAENVDEGARANPDDHHVRAKEAKAAARAAKSTSDPNAQVKTPVERHTDGDVPSDAGKVDSKDVNVKRESADVHAGAEASKKPIDASSVATEAATDNQPKTRREEKHHEQVTPEAVIAKQSAAQPLAGTKEFATAKKSTGELIGDAPSRKGDKKVSPRATATPADTSSAPTERPVAIAATADATTTTAAPVVSQPQLPAATAAATSSAIPKPQESQAISKQGFLSPFARLERGTHSARGANHAGQTDAPRQVDPARFVSRVARAIHTAQERGGPLQLRLSPPELGAMRLELSMNHGALTATIETDNTSTRQLLLDNLPALRERLAEQNVKIERFDVDVRRDPSGNQQNTAPQDRGQAEHHDRRSGRASSPRSQSAVPSIEETTPIRRNISNTSINVVA